MQIAALLLSAVFAQAAPTAIYGALRSRSTTGSAAVTGTVNPGGDATTYQFEYGTSASYGPGSPAQDAGSGTVGLGARATLLSPTTSTTYHYRFCGPPTPRVWRVGSDKHVSSTGVARGGAVDRVQKGPQPP